MSENEATTRLLPMTESEARSLAWLLHASDCGYHRYLNADELEREAGRQAQCMEAYQRECEADGQ